MMVSMMDVGKMGMRVLELPVPVLVHVRLASVPVELVLVPMAV